jgi:16S rRNA (uracil1498-N3)-methyltransferase
MRLTRVYVEEALAPGTSRSLAGNAATHITRVLRLERGATLTLFDGRGGEYAARVEDLRKDRVLVSIGAHAASERESPLAIVLAQGVSRGERMDLVVQKATELGVRRIVPLVTERTVVRLDPRQADNRLRHWRAIAIAACEQCGRNTLPLIDASVRLDEWLGTASDSLARSAEFTRIVLSPEAELRVRDLAPSSGGFLVLIGPEGGLAESEQTAAHAAGFQALTLGPRILRTETAAIAALAALQERLGDL